MELTYVHKKFYSSINYLSKNQRLSYLIVSISGGQDSLCLIKLLQDFKKYHQQTLEIHYIYIDHQWKQDSKSQIKHLINFINTIKEDIYIYQIRNTVESETDARKLRYQILINHGMHYENPIIITAHTATDKTETFLNNIIRGTSIDGITSFNNHRILERNIQLWRPLINFTRIEVHWFCRKYCLPIWSDITNYYYCIHRNRIRNELIPYLKQYFQCNIEKQIYRFLESSCIDNEYMKQNAIKLYLLSRHDTSIAINYDLIKTQHISLRIRTLQIFLYHNMNIIINHYVIKKLIGILNKVIEHNNSLKWCNVHLNIYNNWVYIY